VPPPAGRSHTGEKPVSIVPAWTSLKVHREKLIADGLVRIDPIEGVYYGRFDVEFHAS
jgi:hypothetical protein